MSHFATPEFWARYRRLPAEVQRLADKNYWTFKLELAGSWIRKNSAFSVAILNSCEFSYVSHQL